MTNTVIPVHATGTQIQALVDKLVMALPDGSDRSHCIIACLTLAIVLSKEDVTPDEIQEGVKGASAWLCTYLTNAVEANQVN